MVFLPLLFSANESWAFDDIQSFYGLLLSASVGFVAFVFASSSVYLFNDVLDRDKDIYHPEKRLRPIASKLVSLRIALLFSLLFSSIAVIICVVLLYDAVIYICAYLVLMAIYSLFLRGTIVVDILSISAGFVLRVLVGAIAINVPVSIWLYTCMGLGAMFIALSKRYAEFLAREKDSSLTRKSLPIYSKLILERATYVFLIGTIFAYGLYTVNANNLPSNKLMVLTVPFVAFGMLRYQVLVNQRGFGERPEEIITKDFILRICVLTWLLLVLILLTIFR
jgi:4-hydroxybenzoate polyprenyltransferase